MAITKYIDEKTGKTRYWLKGYIGIDPLTGKEKRVNRKNFTSRKQAELTLAKLQLGLEETKSTKISFEDMYNIWLDDYKDEVKGSTLSATRDIFRLHILPEFGDYLIDKIQHNHIQKWVKEKAVKYVKYKDFHDYFEKVIILAKSKGYRKDNPCEGISFPKKIAKKAKKIEVIWDRPQLNYFLNFTKENQPLKDYAMFRLLAYTGVRRGELIAFEWTDLSFITGMLNVDKSRKVIDNHEFKEDNAEPRKIEVTGDTKTGDKRTLKIDKITLDILYKWKIFQTKVMGQQKLIFTNGSGEYLLLNEPLKTLNRVLKKINRKDEIDLPRIDIHRFRHIHTTMLILSNKTKNSLGAIMDRMGHADITTTLNIYNHIMKEEKVEILDDFISYINQEAS